MEKELIINLGLNRRQAEQASQQFVQGERQRIQKLLTDVEVAEAAKTAAIQRENQRRIAAEVSWLEAAKGAGAKRLTDVEAKEAAHSRLVERENQKRIDAFVKAFSREEKEAARALTDVEVAEQAKTRAVERANQQRVQAALQAGLSEEERIGRALTDTEVAERAKAALIERTNRQRVDAAVRAEMKEEELLTKELTKEQVTMRARDALVQRHNQQRVDAEVRATEASEKGWGATETFIAGAGKALGSFAVQMLGLNSAQAVLGTIVEHFAQAKREAMEAVNFVQGYREALLELAALKGQLGDSTETLKEDLAFRAKTLQTAQASRAFQLAALGAGESAIGVNISQPEFRKAMELGGQFQAAETGSAETHGRLIGMIPTLMGKKGVTGEEAFAKEQQLYSIFKPGGGSFSQMTNQFLQQAPLVTSGLFDDPAKMAALLSAFSTTNAEGAGTNVQQFTRATVGGLGRMRGAQIEGLVEKQGEYLKALGATNQMDPTQIGKLISGDFTRQEGLAAQQGQKFNAMDYMKHHGFANQEDIMAVLAFHGLMKTGQFEQSFEPLAAKPPTAAEALAPIQAKMRSDEVFRGRKTQISGELAQLQLGGGDEELLKNILEPAFNRLKGKGTVAGNFQDVMTRTMGRFDPRELLFGERHKTEMEAQRALVEEGRRVGLNPELPFHLAHGGIKVPDFMGNERLAELARQVQARGGDVQAGFGGDVAKTVERIDEGNQILKEIRDELKAANKGKASPPIQGRPRPVPTR